MITIIMIACCYVGALGPEAVLILVSAAKLALSRTALPVAAAGATSAARRRRQDE